MNRDEQASLQRARITFYIGCLLALCVLLPLWRALGMGLILGYFSEGAVAYLARRFRLQRWGRMIAAGALVGTVLLIFLIPIGVGVYRAGSDLLPALHESAVKLGLDTNLLSASFERWLSEQLARWNLSLSTTRLTELGLRLQQAGTAGLLTLVGWLRGLVSATPGFLFNLTIVVLTWWLAAVEGAAQRERLLRWLLPWPQPRAILSKSVVEVLRGLIVANLAVAAVQAAICTGALAVFRIPHAFSLGVLTFFLAFVPVIGTGLVTVGSAIYLFAQGRVGAGLAMFGGGAFRSGHRQRAASLLLAWPGGAARPVDLPIYRGWHCWFRSGGSRPRADHALRVPRCPARARSGSFA